MQSTLFSAPEVQTEGDSTGTEQGSSQSNQIMEEINETVIERVVEQPKPRSLYASLVDPDDGTELKLYPER